MPNLCSRSIASRQFWLPLGGMICPFVTVVPKQLCLPWPCWTLYHASWTAPAKGCSDWLIFSTNRRLNCSTHHACQVVDSWSVNTFHHHNFRCPHCPLCLLRIPSRLRDEIFPWYFCLSFVSLSSGSSVPLWDEIPYVLMVLNNVFCSSDHWYVFCSLLSSQGRTALHGAFSHSW